MKLKLLTGCVLVVFLAGAMAATDVFFSSCGERGFTCIKGPDNNFNIYFQCNGITAQDVNFNLWAFRQPANFGNITIRNCEKVVLSIMCSAVRKFTKQLVIENVKQLVINPTNLPHLPEIVIFRKVGFIERIQKETFSQILKRSNRPSCFVQGTNINSITFENVTIGTIETDAFPDMTNMEHFLWDKVKVSRMQTNSIKLVTTAGANVTIRNSELDILEHLSFQITSEKAVFSGNSLIEMHASSINGTILNFDFDNNSVVSVDPYAIAILSQNVNITNNKFTYMKSGALQRIGPGLLHDSRANFGSLKFLYEFSRNNVSEADVHSLNPDTVAYDNVATIKILRENVVFCNCEKLGWLALDVGLGAGQNLTRKFYAHFLDDAEKNLCSFDSCHKPLNTIRDIYNGCLKSTNYVDYCDDDQGNSNKKLIKIKYDVQNSTKQRITFFRKNSSTNNERNFFVYFVILLVNCWL